MNSDTKLLIKVQKPRSTECIWVHFCYVDTEVYEEFLSRYNYSADQLNQLLSKWCKEDFKVTIKMITMEDLRKLRTLIKDHYNTQYPELFRASRTDRQGWTRVWISEHMRKEVENIGK